MKYTIATAITIALTIIAGACSAPESPLPAPGRPLTGLTVDSLGIDIAPEQQREYSFTDKKHSGTDSHIPTTGTTITPDGI